MSQLLAKITEDMKAAMKAGEKDKVGTLRMISAEAKNKRIEKKVEALSDEDVIGVLAGMKKKRLEAAETYDQGGRAELAEKERAEAALIESYLPAQLSDADLEKLVAEAVAQTGAAGLKDMGKVIGAVMAKAKGQADGARVSALVKKKLAG